MRTKHCLAVIVATSLVCASFALAATVDTARLDRAFAQLQSYNWGQPADALLGLDETIAATHGDTPTRRQLERRLIVILETNAPVAAKQWVCRRLAIIGNQASVPALAALLTNDELSHPARIALERIPDAAAATALRDALPKS